MSTTDHFLAEIASVLKTIANQQVAHTELLTQIQTELARIRRAT